jgi:hypothetical protein
VVVCVVVSYGYPAVCWYPVPHLGLLVRPRKKRSHATRPFFSPASVSLRQGAGGEGTHTVCKSDSVNLKVSEYLPQTFRFTESDWHTH